MTDLGLTVDRPFLEALFVDVVTDGLNINWRGLRHDGRDPRQGFASSIAELLDNGQLIELNRDGRSIYFGVAPRRGRDGTKSGCVGVPALWVDLDAKDFGAGDAGKA